MEMSRVHMHEVNSDASVVPGSNPGLSSRQTEAFF
jgi:hypothetical protein